MKASDFNCIGLLSFDSMMKGLFLHEGVSASPTQREGALDQALGFRPKPENPEPETLNPKALNPKALNPKTLNPKP